MILHCIEWAISWAANHPNATTWILMWMLALLLSLMSGAALLLLSVLPSQILLVHNSTANIYTVQCVTFIWNISNLHQPSANFRSYHLFHVVQTTIKHNDILLNCISILSIGVSIKRWKRQYAAFLLLSRSV